MDARLLISFFLSIFLISYMAIISLPHAKTSDNPSVNLTPNTQVYIHGIAKDVSYSGKEARFTINNTKIHARGIMKVPPNLSIVGFIEEYNGKVWVQALVIKNND